MTKKEIRKKLEGLFDDPINALKALTVGITFALVDKKIVTNKEMEKYLNLSKGYIVGEWMKKPDIEKTLDIMDMTADPGKWLLDQVKKRKETKND